MSVEDRGKDRKKNVCVRLCVHAYAQVCTKVCVCVRLAAGTTNQKTGEPACGYDSCNCICKHWGMELDVEV